MPQVWRRPTEDEVRHAYRLFLGRDAENDQVVQELAQAAGEDWLTGFLCSEEFRAGTAEAVIARKPLRQQLLSPVPSPELLSWVADQVPLGTSARAGIVSGVGWAQLMLDVFSDDTFTRQVLAHANVNWVMPEFLAALEERVRNPPPVIVGAVEVVSENEIKGWIVNETDPDQDLVVELNGAGRFVAAARADIFRREVQERFGGHGRYGFSLKYDFHSQEGKDARGTIIEQRSGVAIAEFALPTHKAPPLDLLASLRREIAEVRAVLSRIEGRLPEFNRTFEYGLAAYPEYFDRYYGAERDRPTGREAPIDLTMILIAAGSTPADLTRTLASIAEQRGPIAQIVLIQAVTARRLEEEAAIARGMAAMPVEVEMVRIDCGGSDWSEALNAAIAQARAANILIVRAQGALSPFAAREFAHVLDRGAWLAYADEDRVELSADGAALRHEDPVFRTAFDQDALEQVDSVGDVIAVRRDAVSRFGFRRYSGTATLYDLVLRMGSADPTRIANIPRVLFHRTCRPSFAPAADRLAVLRDHLEHAGGGVRPEFHADPLGAQVRGALRVKRLPPPMTSVAIIIPTRDRLELLGPCLAAISAAKSASAVEIEVIVVDNDSQSAATRAVLNTLEQAGSIRVMKFEEPFNWALINNRAAAMTQADVLVFLNNDTVNISRDCWDELAAQALRPDVGAVGARLLYEDGSIQHAGIVTGDWNGFATHEGVGDPGSEPGYQGRHSLLRQVSAVTGACLATRADVFRTLGGFDETMPLEGNDVDYCFRAIANGFKVLYDPYATLYHFESKSRGFNVTAERQQAAHGITLRLRERWEERFGDDPFYNAHFDRLAPAMTKLRPPPVTASERDAIERPA